MNDYGDQKRRCRTLADSHYATVCCCKYLSSIPSALSSKALSSHPIPCWIPMDSFALALSGITLPPSCCPGRVKYSPDPRDTHVCALHRTLMTPPRQLPIGLSPSLPASLVLSQLPHRHKINRKVSLFSPEDRARASFLRSSGKGETW